MLVDGLFLKALVFQHIVVLLLTHCCGGQPEVVGPPIVALVGDDSILPCHLDPAADAVSMILEWGRPDLKPRFVHVWHEGQDLLVNQNPSYKGRTSLSTDKLKHGDLSLKLSAVKLSDSGTYRCLIPKLSKESTVQLVVGAVSSPVISGINISSNAGVLQCESEGWYPEPEVFWLDGEGNLLSAGPTETVRGPDDLYTVSSRVTVEKRHSNSFTCRVQQKDINQTRETHIQVTGFIISAECSTASSSSVARISIILAALFIFILAVVFIVWKWQQKKTQINISPVDESEQTEQREQLMANSESKEDSEEKKTKIDEQKKEEEQKKIALVVNTFEEQMKELRSLREKLKRQKDDMERENVEIEKKLKSVEKETEHDRAKGFWDLKEIVIQNKGYVQNRKQEQEQLVQNTDQLLIKVQSVLKEMKMKLESPKEEISVNGGDKQTGS